MGKTLVVLTLMVAAAAHAAGQTLQADPARDLALHATVQATQKESRNIST